jgi:peptidoglycan/LPS O-acetylase OafA/YrhL
MGRIPELDGLRGFAILLVLIYHYVVFPLHSLEPRSPTWLAACLDLTWSGVDLFFVLSGFLVGGLLYDARESPYYFRTFFARRVCRIFPLYYVLLTLVFLGGPYVGIYTAVPGGPHFTPAGPSPVSCIFFLQNFWAAETGTPGSLWLAVTWSLAVEEQFYLVIPFLIRYFPARYFPPLLFALVALAVAVHGLRADRASRS